LTWVFEELHYLILILLTVVANVFFGRVTNIIVLAGIFFLLDKALLIYKAWKEGRNARKPLPIS